MNFKKGKLTKDGQLMIEKGGKIFLQECMKDDELICSENCVGFGEPMQHENGYGFPKWELEICEKTLTFDEFADERGKDEG